MRQPIPTQGSICIVDATGRRVGFSIQNPSAVDVYYTDDQRQLDSVPATNLPQVGHLLAAQTPVPPPTVYHQIANKKVYARAQSVGAALEIMVYEVDLPVCQQ